MARRTTTPPTKRWLPRDIAHRLRFVEPDPTPGRFQTTHSVATIAMDADRDGGWMVLLDDVLASYADLSDPTHLEFEYTRWMADLIDASPPGPTSVLHLGGAACTLPVYVEVTRPGSKQIVIEHDELLIELMRQQFGIRSSRRMSIRCEDALEAIRATPEDSHDVIIRDAFGGSLTPPHLRTLEFAREVRRVLRPGGIYLANIGDRPGLEHTRELLAQTQEAFGLRAGDRDRATMAMICEPSVLRGRRFGNVVAALSDRDLPLEGWLQATRRAELPARVNYGERLWSYLTPRAAER